jgi:NAD(P)-dependent dehydrogenase (short-subunit alcohol dehydrogenase family)
MRREIDLSQAVVVITGASSGIGSATARLLAGGVHRLVTHGLAPVDLPGAAYVPGDFRRLDSAVATAQRVSQLTDRVDVLINNAAMPGASQRTVTSDGHELTLQVNLLAGALLTDRLLPLIPDGGRIVNVASATHYSASLDLDDLELAHGGYSPVRAYAHSKLAIVTYSAWLGRELKSAGVDVASVHPGIIGTGLLHAMFGAGGAPAEGAASVLVDLAQRPLESGAYYDEHNVTRPNPEALDRSKQEGLARYVQAAVAPFAAESSMPRQS